MLSREGLPGLSAADFYNLNRKNEKEVERLTKQEEISLILHHLEMHGFHVQVRYEHLLDNGGERLNQRVIKDIFFISPAQIELGRRFVSRFMYQTDATFNTNELRLPLSSMVGITNTGHTFPLAYCYITSESAKSFEFVAGELTKYVFYDCPEVEVIIADFTRGLGAAIAAKARLDSSIKEDEECEIVGASEVLVDGASERAKIRLQLCEWHATEAIKKRLIHAGKYTKERREELTNLVHAWIKAPANSVSEAREKLLEQLEPKEKEYLTSYYQPKEENFLQAFTRTYRNLGCHSTQHNESYHPITKHTLH